MDDDSVELLPEEHIARCFGTGPGVAAATDTGYMLFYEAKEPQHQQHHQHHQQQQQQVALDTAASRDMHARSETAMELS